MICIAVIAMKMANGKPLKVSRFVFAGSILVSYIYVLPAIFGDTLQISK
jgi:hypothetical protein